MSIDGHCLRCPTGKFQEADGRLACHKCESGKYTQASHDRTVCHSCRTLDAERKYDTKGLSGQSQCWPVPVDCLPGSWGSYGTCSKSCGTGKHTRTRTPMRQPAQGLCSVASCSAAWGGGAECSQMLWSETRDCNTQACPVDCVVTAWSSWLPCSQSCGRGTTERKRAVSTHMGLGGKGCPSLSDRQDCNPHSCALPDLPACHNEHVRCHVRELSHPNSRDKRPNLPHCGASAVEDQNMCWNNRNCLSCLDMRAGAYTTEGCNGENCHRADDDAEKALGVRIQEQYAACVANEGEAAIKKIGRALNGLATPCKRKFDTVVVTHDRKFYDHGGAFHCARDGAKGCKCKCNHHPPCCSVAGTTLTNAVIVGGADVPVGAKQECCNLCTNHPHCTSWDFKGMQDGTSHLCTLRHGEPVFVSAATNGAAPIAAGRRSGTAC